MNALADKPATARFLQKMYAVSYYVNGYNHNTAIAFMNAFKVFTKAEIDQLYTLEDLGNNASTYVWLSPLREFKDVIPNNILTNLLKAIQQNITRYSYTIKKLRTISILYQTYHNAPALRTNLTNLIEAIEQKNTTNPTNTLLNQFPASLNLNPTTHKTVITYNGTRPLILTLTK